MLFKKSSNFHWFILRGFNFIKTVYELFDNPSYLTFIKIYYFFPDIFNWSLFSAQYFYSSINLISLSSVFGFELLVWNLFHLNDTVKFSLQNLVNIFSIFYFIYTKFYSQKSERDWAADIAYLSPLPLARSRLIHTI